MGKIFKESVNDSKATKGKGTKRDEQAKVIAGEEQKKSEETTKVVTAFSYIFKGAENAKFFNRENACELAQIRRDAKQLYKRLFSLLAIAAEKNVTEKAASVTSAPDFVNQKGETIAAANLWAERSLKLVKIAKDDLHKYTKTAHTVDGVTTLSDTFTPSFDLRKMYVSIVGAIKSAELIRKEVEQKEKAAALAEKAAALAKELEFSEDKILSMIQKGFDEEKIKFTVDLIKNM